MYDKTSKTVTCLVCQGGAPTEPPAVDDSVRQPAWGTAGASARREFERRRSAREQRIRKKHPRLGGLLLAMSDQPQSTRAWEIGAVGEEALGRRLDALAGPSLQVLHDRRIPKTKANIDHVVVCPTGVLVIDAKRYAGRPRLRIDGGFLSERTERLMVGSRDCTKLVDGVLHQVGLVRATLGDDSVRVRGFLCFVAADWPLIGGSFTTRGVSALWPRKLAAVMSAPGSMTEDNIADVRDRLAKAFPMA